MKDAEYLQEMIKKEQENKKKEQLIKKKEESIKMILKELKDDRKSMEKFYR